MSVSPTVAMLWIVALFVLEVNHLRWIWWEHWDCRGCGEKNRACGCESSKRWLMYL